MTEKTDAEILNEIKTKRTVPVWPHYGFVYDCSRNKAYEEARKGGEEFIRIGKMIRVVTAPLRRRLGIEGA